MRERVKKPCAEIAVTMGASLKPAKGPLSPRQKLVGRVARSHSLLPRHRGDGGVEPAWQ